MIIQTASGKIVINKRSIYGNWLRGYCESGAFTGAYSLKKAYGLFIDSCYRLGVHSQSAPKGKAAYTAGYLQGKAYMTGRAAGAETE